MGQCDLSVYPLGRRQHLTVHLVPSRFTLTWIAESSAALS